MNQTQSEPDRVVGVWTCLMLAMTVGACSNADNPGTTQPNLAVTTELSPTSTMSVGGTASLNSYAGIPFGPSELWRDHSTLTWGPAPFTSSSNFTDAPSIVRHLRAAQATNQKLILNMTGGSHSRYKTDNKFDLAKWLAVMNTYDRDDIKVAVAEAVADGTVIMNSVMDEPHVNDWGGVMNKPLLDQMASYVKKIFPTLPVGVVARFDWRPEERYQVMDAIVALYAWNKGDVRAYKDKVLARAQLEGVEVLFAMNILDGGIYSWQTKVCPMPLTGGYGTYSPACRMTANQVRDWGQILGVAGCAMLLWRYDADFMSNPGNVQAFTDVAVTLAGARGKPCRRLSEGTPSPPANTLPTAEFDPPSCTAGVACEFEEISTDADGSIVGRSWNFGDGTTSTESVASNSYAMAGLFSVTLAVTDNDGGTAAVAKDVTVHPVIIALQAAFTPPTCIAGLACQFRDNSSDPDGSIAQRRWDFGDGETSTEKDPSNIYASAGTNSVTLTITDEDGTTAEVTKDVTVRGENTPPEAGFTPPDCITGRACRFTDGSSDSDGSIAHRRWEFGDGVSSSEAAPEHVYATAGAYGITLVVTDNDGGTAEVTKDVTVTSVNTPPEAAFSPPDCTVGLGCQFTDGSSDADGSIAQRSWDFGDGVSSSEEAPEHIYATAGLYRVTLAVTDNDGGTADVTRDVTVLPARSPPEAAYSPPDCTSGLTCQFTDGSSDADNQITGWSWAFGDGGTSDQRNPSHIFQAAGAYKVALTIAHAGGQDQYVASVSVSTPTPSMELTVRGSTDATRQYMLLKWTGGTGAAVDVYRNGLFLTNTPNDGQYTNSRNLPGSSSYTYKVCQTGTPVCSNEATVTFLPANAPPVANFTSSCSGLTCTFSDRSTDTDGTVIKWMWTFGDGGTSTARNPSRRYASARAYTVTLMVTDDDGATHQRTASVSVAPIPTIVLSVTGRTDATRQLMLLKWTGATGTALDVYRNGAFLTNTPNDGQYTNSRNLPGSSSYVYKVCRTGTTICSNQGTVTF